MDSLGISANMEKTAPAEEADLETRLENVYQKTQLVSAIADPAYKLVKFFNM
jgi:hypothetical protein